jgi:hypothetical protein
MCNMMYFEISVMEVLRLDIPGSFVDLCFETGR